MRTDDGKPPLLLLWILAVLMAILLLLVPCYSGSKKTPQTGSQSRMELFLEAPRNPYLENREEHYYNLIKQYDWDTDLMYRIMECESRFNPETIGDQNTPYSSYGLLQVRNLPERNLEVADLFVPEKNIEIAYQIYRKQSYWAWANCYKRVRMN